MEKWQISADRIRHSGQPEFEATWCSGEPDDFEAIEGPFYYEENSGQGDQLLIYGFDWKNGPPPAAPEFEGLMQAAITAIDDWISGRL